MVKTVCVVGCGAAGLTSIKTCLEQGLDVTAYEQDEEIGGTWYYKKGSKLNQGATAYKRLVSNGCSEMSAFSDFPFPDGTPQFYSHEAALKYLKDYATHFDLWRHIKLNTEVLNVRRTENYNETGQWRVITKEQDSKQTKEEIFDAVMIAHGMFRKDHIPDISGISTFTGHITSATKYREGEEFRDQTVLLIGNGFTAGDLATDIAAFAKKVVLAVGDGTWVLPTHIAGNLTSDCGTTRYTAYFERKETFNKEFYDWANTNVDHLNTGLASETPPGQGGMIVSDHLGHLISCGKITVKGHVKRISENLVYFNDNSAPISIGHILFASGYLPDFPFLEPDTVTGKEYDFGLYKHILPVNLKHKTLAFIGMVQIITAIWPMCELQARWTTGIFRKKINITKAEMEQEISCLTKEKIKMRKRDLGYYVGYEDKLANDIGCKPKFWKYLFTDPKLAYAYLYNPIFPSQWRIEGPNSCPDARERYITGVQRMVTTTKARNMKAYTPKIAWLNTKNVALLTSFCAITSLILNFVI